MGLLVGLVSEALRASYDSFADDTDAINNAIAGMA
jgi:hypothetical protein